jgi:hypothetical protein
LQHYFCGLYDRCDRVSDFEVHLFRASSGYHAFDEIFPNLHNAMSHHSAELKFRDFAFQAISCR